MLQVDQLHSYFDELQTRYGDSSLKSIYGAGETHNPEYMFIFMNPTGRNVASSPVWNGLRAPWLGTKHVWGIFKRLNLLNDNIYDAIMMLKPNDWNSAFANEVYSDIKRHSVYVTNLAKCTQSDAKHLGDKVFKEYLDLMYQEIEIVNPKRIISFGNQVSSILLKKPISVSNYLMDSESLVINRPYMVYPTYYPVGQGQRNMPMAIERIMRIL